MGELKSRRGVGGNTFRSTTLPPSLAPSCTDDPPEVLEEEADRPLTQRELNDRDRKSRKLQVRRRTGFNWGHQGPGERVTASLLYATSLVLKAGRGAATDLFSP